QDGDSQGEQGTSLPPGQVKKAARPNYTSCPGLSSEFQLRTPLVGNSGFRPGSPIVMQCQRATTMFGEPGNGPATVNLGNVTLLIPGTSNYSITNKPGPVGPPTVMAPGGSSPLSTVPAAPPDLL